MSETTTNSRLKLDAADHQVQVIVNTLYHHILRDFIAHANEREVLNNLYRFYTESDMVLISKVQLKAYKEIEKLIIDTSLTNPIKGLLPNG